MFFVCVINVTDGIIVMLYLALFRKRLEPARIIFKDLRHVLTTTFMITVLCLKMDLHLKRPLTGNRSRSVGLSFAYLKKQLAR